MAKDIKESKRKRTAPVQIKRWRDEEIKKLISAYESGKKRQELVRITGRSNGSVANKIRLLIQEGILPPRRG